MSVKCGEMKIIRVVIFTYRLLNDTASTAKVYSVK